MHNTIIMSASFEAEKNRKAFLYTLIIVGAFLLLAIFWTWIIPPPPAPIVQDMIEVNLGNMDEGFGSVQPLVKGEKSPGEEPAEQQHQPVASSNPEPAKQQMDDDSKDADAIPVTKPVKAVTKPTVTPTPPTTKPVANTPPVTVPEPKPQKPKIAGYSGPKGGTGNGATEDNGYKYQGNNPGGKGDAGSPDGKPDSYGNNPGGRTGGGPRVTSGDRKIIRYYSFTADLPKATIFATVRVSPDGIGTFVGFGKNSTSTAQAYANEIAQRLPTVQFDKSDHVSTVTVQFNFTIK